MSVVDRLPSFLHNTKPPGPESEGSVTRNQRHEACQMRSVPTLISHASTANARGMSMTPSNWNGQQRDAGHDDMQAYVYSRLLAGEWNFAGEGWNQSKVVIEYPFSIRTRVVGFADIGALYWQVERYPHGATSTYYKWIFFELKPVIESVGAIIRQCRAIEELAKGISSGSNYVRPKFEVIAVVYDDDPKLHLLTKMHGNVVSFNRNVVSTFIQTAEAMP